MYVRFPVGLVLGTFSISMEPCPLILVILQLPFRGVVMMPADFHRREVERHATSSPRQEICPVGTVSRVYPVSRHNLSNSQDTNGAPMYLVIQEPNSYFAAKQRHTYGIFYLPTVRWRRLPKQTDGQTRGPITNTTRSVVVLLLFVGLLRNSVVTAPVIASKIEYKKQVKRDDITNILRAGYRSAAT